MAKHGVQGWRQPSLPGVDAPLPAGATGLACSTRENAAIQKQKRTFDNVKDVKAMAAYAADAQDLLDAQLLELAQRGNVGPGVAMAVITSATQFMWARFMFDRAAAQETTDFKLVETASRIADAANANVARAHELHTKLLLAQAAKATPRDVLDGFSDAPVEDPAPAEEPK